MERHALHVCRATHDRQHRCRANDGREQNAPTMAERFFLPCSERSLSQCPSLSGICRSRCSGRCASLGRPPRAYRHRNSSLLPSGHSRRTCLRRAARVRTACTACYVSPCARARGPQRRRGTDGKCATVDMSSTAALRFAGSARSPGTAVLPAGHPAAPPLAEPGPGPCRAPFPQPHLLFPCRPRRLCRDRAPAHQTLSRLTEAVVART